MKRKKLNSIYIVSMIIIVMASLEAFAMAKSSDIYEQYLQANGDGTANDFLAAIMINFFTNIIEPVVISLYIFFATGKYGFTNLAKFIFSGLIFIRLVMIISSLNVNSLFFYLMIVLYIILLISVITFQAKKEETK